MAIQVQAPHDVPPGTDNTVFMAGSIEMGVAENWQTRLVNAFDDEPNLTFLNPRRDDWDSSWVQSIHNAQFNQQVTWELDGLEQSNMVLFYFDPDTKSPITLLELGFVAGFRNPYNVVVCCPMGFWRKGNVDILCKRWGIQVVETMDELIVAVKEKLYGES